MYRHIIDPAAQGGGSHGAHRYFVYSYQYGAYSDVIPLAEEDEVYRRDVGIDGVARATYVVYRLKG